MDAGRCDGKEGDAMSARIFPDDILFFQRLLRSDGLYLGDLDGIWGPITEAAAVEFERRADAIAAAGEPVLIVASSDMNHHEPRRVAFRD